MVKLSRKRSRTGSRVSKRRTSSKSKKRSASAKTVSGYCVKCRQARTMGKPKLVMTKNKRRMMKGKCPVCGTTMTRFVKK